MAFLQNQPRTSSVGDNMDYESLTMVDFKDEYAQRLSAIITENLLSINTKDYSKEEMLELSLRFTPDKIRALSNNKKMFVATVDNQPVGTLSVQKDVFGGEDDYVISTVFVCPEHHGEGVGRLLVKAGEKHVDIMDGKKITLSSSITAHDFYHKLGYRYIEDSIQPNADGCIMMTKFVK
jgi:GNAT superfamily N-acetyltransferase